jgi:hypothetical protein
MLREWPAGLFVTHRAGAVSGRAEGVQQRGGLDAAAGLIVSSTTCGRWSGRGTGHGRPPYQDAARHYRRALDVVLTSPGWIERRRRVRPLVGVGDALRRSGGRLVMRPW